MTPATTTTAVTAVSRGAAAATVGAVHEAAQDQIRTPKIWR
jgi:hypothetical protein